MEEKTRDAAVQIVEEALAWTGFGHSRDAVEALADHYEFCPPGTLARLAALEKVAEAWAAMSPTQRTQVLMVDGYLSAALDAAPPTAGRDPAGAQGEDVERYPRYPRYPRHLQGQYLKEPGWYRQGPQPAGDDPGRV